MVRTLTFKQKILIAFSLPLIILLINSLMAVSQLQKYHHVMEFEIIRIQDSNTMKSDVNNLLDTSDKIANSAMLSVIFFSVIGIILVVALVVLAVKSLHIPVEGDKGEGDS